MNEYKGFHLFFYLLDSLRRIFSSKGEVGGYEYNNQQLTLRVGQVARVGQLTIMKK